MLVVAEVPVEALAAGSPLATSQGSLETLLPRVAAAGWVLAVSCQPAPAVERAPAAWRKTVAWRVPAAWRAPAACRLPVSRGSAPPLREPAIGSQLLMIRLELAEQ